MFAGINRIGAVLVETFKPNVTGASDLYEDTDLNDGIGDGTRLIVDLFNFLFLIPGSGDSLVLSIELTSTSSFEPLAVDNVRFLADVPKQSPILLVFFGLAALGVFGRRVARR